MVERCPVCSQFLPRMPGVRLNSRNGVAILNGEVVKLSPTELAMLDVLNHESPQFVSCLNMHIALNDLGFDPPTDGAIRSYICILRRKIKPHGFSIETKVKIGNRLSPTASRKTSK